ncbi:MAG TPA: TonB-dependent receptor [Syntrophorhabdaceae bacterium]|nr:TonB-dependent receptor [Syntrophorhabdaceae bacterium]
MHFIILNILLFFFLVFNPPTTFAQQGPYKLDEIVVTASRIATPLVETQANITIITKEDIEQMGATTVIDIFKGEPGVFTANLLNNPKTAQVDIRGFGETAPSNVLFLIDGRRINGIDMSGADLTQIPVEMIERVEIYRGPATVLFGDNAVAGVINIIMKKGEGKPKAKASIVAGSYGLFSPKLSILGRQERFSYYGLASSYDTEGYRHNNSIRTKDLFGNFSFDALKTLTLNLQTGFHKDTYGLPGALSFDELKTGKYSRKDSKTPDDSADTEDNFINLGADLKPFDDFVFSLNGSYRIRHNSAKYVSSNWYTMRTLKTYGLLPKITLKKSIGSMNNTLVAGFDYYKNPTRATDFSPGLWGTDSVTKITRTDYAFYINEELSPIRDIIISAGYRFQKSFWDINYVDNLGALPFIDRTVNDKKEAFRVSVNYLIGKRGNAFLTYAKGFRMPVTDELFNVWAIPPVNDALKTQVVKEWDGGVRYNITEWIGSSFTFFYSKTDDEIYYNPYTFSNGNYDKTKRQGVEAAIFLDPLKDLRISIQYSYVDARFDGGEFDNNKIPLVPKDKITFKSSYKWKNLTSNVTLSYLSKRYLISDQKNDLPQLPGVTLIDIDFKYALGNFEALFGIKNLTNKKYSEYGVASYLFGQPPLANYYPSPERNFYCGLSYNY